MNNSLEYKGYQGIVEFSSDDNVFFGKIFGINDLITFEGESVKQLEKNFRLAVDDYLSTCEEMGKEPERPYKGNFNIRISPETHRKAAYKAQQLNISLNELVENAIEKEVRGVKILNLPARVKNESKQMPRSTRKVNHSKKRMSIQKKK